MGRTCGFALSKTKKNKFFFSFSGWKFAYYRKKAGGIMGTAFS
jgi:hypothetical protein